MSSDLEHFKINATVFNDRVEEFHFILGPTRNIRRQPQTTIWRIERFLGRGSFGEVRLERNEATGQARAVKRISTFGASLTTQECDGELRALLEISKPKVSGKQTSFGIGPSINTLIA
jgi:hypothetical protein